MLLVRGFVTRYTQQQSTEISRVIPVHKFIKYTLVCEAILFSPGGEELFPCVRGISYERRLEFYDEKFRSRQSYIICKAYTLAKEWSVSFSQSRATKKYNKLWLFSDYLLSILHKACIVTRTLKLPVFNDAILLTRFVFSKFKMALWLKCDVILKMLQSIKKTLVGWNTFFTTLSSLTFSIYG